MMHLEKALRSTGTATSTLELDKSLEELQN